MMTAEARDLSECSESSDTGDSPTFESLARLHHARLYRFVYRYVGNEADAEDLTQDTLVKAYRYFDRYDASRPFVAWLLTIGRRTVSNHFRAMRETEELDERDLAADASLPSEAAEERETESGLWEVVGELKPKYRETLELRYREDLSVKEIAQILDTTQANVKIRLFRGRSLLRKALEGREEIGL